MKSQEDFIDEADLVYGMCHSEHTTKEDALDFIKKLLLSNYNKGVIDEASGVS